MHENSQKSAGIRNNKSKETARPRNKKQQKQNITHSRNIISMVQKGSTLARKTQPEIAVRIRVEFKIRFLFLRR